MFMMYISIISLPYQMNIIKILQSNFVFSSGISWAALRQFLAYLRYFSSFSHISDIAQIVDIWRFIVKVGFAVTSSVYWRMMHYNSSKQKCKALFGDFLISSCGNVQYCCVSPRFKYWISRVTNSISQNRNNNRESPFYCFL